MLIRSLLFAPGNRRDLIAKFPRAGADAVAIDLEDGTPEGEKGSARAALGEVIAGLRAQELRALLFVRTNPSASPHAGADVTAALEAGVDGLIIPKLGTVADLQQLGALVSGSRQQPTRRPLALIGMIETMAGVLNAPSIATASATGTAVSMPAGLPALQGLAFGGEDFISEIGGRRTPGGREVLYARSRVVLAARAAGLTALDQVVVDIRDDGQFERDANEGRNLGYGGKMCLLPRQVDLANAVFSPSPDEIAWSRRLVEACAAADIEGRGVIELDGRMVDAPLLKRSQDVLALAERLGR